MSSPAISVTTIPRDLREVDFTAARINGLILPRREVQNMLFIWQSLAHTEAAEGNNLFRRQ